MVTTRRKIGNFKSRILVSAEQARNETFLSLSLLSAQAFPCFLIHILVKCAKVLLKRQYRLPRSNGTQGEQIGIDLFVSRSSRKMFKLATFTTQVSQKKITKDFATANGVNVGQMGDEKASNFVGVRMSKEEKKESSSNHRQ